jgi:PAS domain S-box-containing protein
MEHMMEKPVIFIVEDEAIVANDIKESLISLGYTVAGTTKSGEIALEKVKEFMPDLVLMDIHIAGRMDGVETAGKIHELYNIPVIYLTAYSDKLLLDRAKVTEPYGYVIKPFDERELQSVIEMAWYKYVMDKKLKESEDSLRKLNDELEARVTARTSSLHEQIRFLQQLIDTIPAPVYYKNLKAEYLGCNNAFETYTGISKREIVGKTDAALFSSDLAVLSDEKDSLLMTRKGIQVYQAKFPHADRNPRDVIFKKATFSNSDACINGFIGVMIDITDRIYTETDLRESEQRFKAIGEDLTELVYRSRPDRTCVYANAAFLRFFNRKETETIGFLYTPPVHPDDANRVHTHFAEMTPENPVSSIIYRVILPDGTVRNLHWNTHAFFYSNGQVREYQSVGHETAGVTGERKPI